MAKSRRQKNNIQVEVHEKSKIGPWFGGFSNFKVVLFALSLLLILVLFVMNVGVANPDSRPFYRFKRLYETVQLRFKATPEDKLDYLYSLLDKRLLELNSVVESGNSPYILNTSLRYSTTAGQITELIIQNNLKNQASKAREKFEDQFLIVKSLPSKYSKADGEVKYIIDDANYLRIYIDQLSSL